MAKKKKPTARVDENDGLTSTHDAIDAESTKKSAKPKNALIYPWLSVFVITAIGSLLLCLWIENSFAIKTNNHISDNYKQSFSDNLTQVVYGYFNATQKQLDNVAADATIKNSLNMQDAVQISSLASLLQASFAHSLSLQIIPWDLSGTVGLKDKNIEPRNNIELALLSRAGSKKTPTPEVYFYNNAWIISFASPVIQDGTVIGILLLSLNSDYLAEILNIPAFTDAANITLQSKSHKKSVISTFGNGTIPANEAIQPPFAESELLIAFNAEKLQTITTIFQPIYIAIGILLTLLLIMCGVGMWMTIRCLKQDIQTMINYIESLSALHKTKQPDLNISLLSQPLKSITHLSAKTTKTTITTTMEEGYKSPQSVKLPEKMGVATVADNNQFEYPEIFRDYDIRGLADTQLNSNSVVMLGKAIGSQAISTGISTIVSGRDGRLSSERIQYDLTRGILSTGCNVVNIGIVPSPVLYYATEKLGTGTGVMVTGSHNPAEYNGLKIVINHKSLHGQDLQELLKRIENYDFATGEGKLSKQDLSEDYIQAISSDIIIAKPLHVVVDAANGVGGAISTQLLNMLDCQVTSLYCEIDGNFPNHGPDPSIRANLTDLINKVRELQADIGIAFDGDADRMVAITATGEVINGDQILMLFAKDIVSRNAGSNIIYDVKCSSNVEKIISQFGGRAIISKSGHSNMKAKMQETDALLGGEFTGHFFFKERWFGFDDGIYAALRLIELLTTNNSTLDDEINALPKSCNTPELYIPLTDMSSANHIIDKLQEALANEPWKIDATDGIRAEFANGWGLIRRSNTSAKLSLRFEAKTEEDLLQIQALFKKALNDLNMNLSIPF